MDLQKKSRFQIEKLEERIAPASVTINNAGVTGGGTITTPTDSTGVPATGDGSLTIAQTGTTLTGTLPT